MFNIIKLNEKDNIGIALMDIPKNVDLNLGIKSIVHQNQVIGSYTMIGMSSIITKNKKILPGYTYYGRPLKKIKMLCRIDTNNELEYYKNGGILQFVLRNMI